MYYTLLASLLLVAILQFGNKMIFGGFALSFLIASIIVSFIHVIIFIQIQDEYFMIFFF